MTVLNCVWTEINSTYSISSITSLLGSALTVNSHLHLCSWQYYPEMPFATKIDGNFIVLLVDK